MKGVGAGVDGVGSCDQGHDNDKCASCIGEFFLNNAINAQIQAATCDPWFICNGAQYVTTEGSNNADRECR